MLADPLEKALALRPQNMFILIDALDELEPGDTRRQFLNLVGQQFPTLPKSVRMIVTSRPENDIVACLDHLKPLELSGEDPRQREDLGIFIQSRGIDATTLKDLSSEERKAVVDFVVGQADGVFLAAQFAERAVIELQEQDLSKKLSLEDVKGVVGKGLEFIYETYRITLGRIVHQLEIVANKDEKLLLELRYSLTKLLAVLVAA